MTLWLHFSPGYRPQVLLRWGRKLLVLPPTAAAVAQQSALIWFRFHTTTNYSVFLGFVSLLVDLHCDFPSSCSPSLTCSVRGKVRLSQVSWQWILLMGSCVGGNSESSSSLSGVRLLLPVQSGVEWSPSQAAEGSITVLLFHQGALTKLLVSLLSGWRTIIAVSAAVFI